VTQSSILVLGSTATLVMTIGDVHRLRSGKVDESDIGKVYLGQARPHQGRVLPGQDLPDLDGGDILLSRAKRIVG